MIVDGVMRRRWEKIKGGNRRRESRGAREGEWVGGVRGKRDGRV